MDILNGLRVIDLAGDVAGAYATRLLAAAGAEVVRVDRPGGDPIWHVAPRVGERADGSILTAYLHAGKRSISLDHSDEHERQELRRLMSTADLVVETAAPGEWASRGVDLHAMMEERPTLVVCSITPFGQDGPRASWRATALPGFAAGGQMSLCGEPDLPPLKAAGHQAHYQAGLSAFAGCLTALFAVRRTGIGDHLDISIQEVQASALEVAGPMALARGFDTRRSGNRLRPTWGIYPCADGYVGVAAMVRQTGEVLRCIGRPDLVDDPAFSNLRSDPTAIEVVSALVLEWTMARTARQVFDESHSFRGPFSMIPTPAELMAWPPLRESGFWSTAQHPVLGEYTVPGIPFTVDGERPVLGRAPLLGEHTHEIRAELAEVSAPSAEAGGGEIQAPGLPFEGLRVLDLSQVWAGPFAARFLADMGADVIHIEGPAFADAVRATGRTPDPRWFNKGPVFNEYNRNKRGIALDLRAPDGLEAFRRLARDADVVIENWSPGVAERLGIGYEDLKAVNPHLVFVQMPAFSQNPPESERMGYGPTVEQMGGLPSLQGYEGGAPQKSGISYGDPTAGTMGAGTVVLGLLRRERVGQGCHVVLSQRDNVTAMIGEFFLAESLGVLPSVRVGNRDLDHAPHNVYRTVDDSGRFEADELGNPVQELHETWIAIAVDSDAAWDGLRQVLADPRLDGPRYATVEGRRRDETLIDAVIAEHARVRDALELASALQEAGVSASPVLTPLMITRDEHLLSRGFITSYDHPEAGTHLTTRPVWAFQRRPTLPTRPAPCFGQHNAEVLREAAGYGPGEITRLVEAGVLVDEPAG